MGERESKWGDSGKWKMIGRRGEGKGDSSGEGTEESTG